MDAIELKYAVEQLGGDTLRISYRVKNGSEQPIFLTTPLVEVGEEAVVPKSERFYAYLDSEGILQVTKRLWPVPEDVDIYLPEVPRLTEVRAGGAFEERLVCAMPVEVSYPYRFAGEEEPETEVEVVTGEAFGLAFSIGYLAEAAGRAAGLVRRLAAQKNRKANEPEGLILDYATALAHHKLLQGGTVALRVSVRDVNREEV